MPPPALSPAAELAPSPVPDDAVLDDAVPDDAVLDRETEAFSELVEAIGSLISTDAPEAIYERISTRLDALVEVDSLAVLFFDEANRTLRFRWARGLDRQLVDHWTFGLGQGLIGRAAAAGVRGDWSAIDGYADRPSSQAHDLLPGSAAQIAVPLPGRERCAGVLHLGRESTERPFGARDKRLAELVARHLGATVESSCSQATTRRLARNLALLQEASRELTSILDRDRLLTRIADITERLVDHQLFVVLLWDEEEEVLRSVFERRSDGSHNPQPTLRLGEGLCGSAAALRQPVRVGNVQHDPRYVACSATAEVRSELAVPLVFEGRLLGVLDVESYSLDAFDAEHEQILATLGANVAVALENAGLYERLREDERLLSRDLHTARQVQRFLLPRATPWVPGLQIGVGNAPARQLGGDIYDFYSYGDDRTALVIGDVAGKGTGAALYGSLAIGLMRGFATDHRCRAFDALAYLDEELRQLQVERRFLALTYAVYDRGSRRLELANAGLPYPILVRGGEAKEIELGSLPLGAGAPGQNRPPRPTVTLDLQVGDLVVFTTDGIDECLSPAREPFGSERVKEILRSTADHEPTEALARRLIEATDAHRGPIEASDDRTVLALRVSA